MLNRATNVFTIKRFSGTNIYGIGLDTAGRLILNGIYSSGGYTAKSMVQSISAHPDFQTAATWTMNLLSPGTEDIVADSGQTIGAVTTRTVSASSPAFSNLTITYVAGTSYNSDVAYYTSSKAYIYAKNAYVQVIPDLTCSTSGSTSIAYSLASYNGNTVPTWININPSTGQLSITTPSPSTNTDYSFYISSTISGVSSVINKLMTISVSSCTASN